MSRPLRLEAPGAIWHVTARGNERRDIYRDDTDRRVWLEILAGVADLHGWRVHGYVLMGNHYHLIVETPVAPSLSRGMRQLNGVYAQRFNRRHRRCGHLFQGRFHGVLVERESHLLELSRYLALNPVRAKRVSDPAAWPWSSFLAIAGLAPAPPWLDTSWTLANFASAPEVAQRAYRTFVAGSSASPNPWSSLKGQIYLGTQAFFTQHIHRAEACTIAREVPRPQRCAPPPPAVQVFAAACAALGVETAQVIRPRHPGPTRALVAHALRRCAGATGGEIGAQLQVTSWSASRLARIGGLLWATRGPTLPAALRGLSSAAAA